MVYRRFKKTYRKRAYGKKKMWYDKTTLGDAGRGAYDLATKAVAGVQYLKGLVNAEMLHYDLNSNFAPINTGAVTSFIAIANGDGESQRTGNSILVRSFNLQFTVVNNAAATAGTIVSSWIIEDTQQIADTTISFSDIFNANDVNSTLAVGTLGRYKILDRKLIIVHPATNTSKYVNIYKKLYHHVRYNGTASTDIQKGGIYWVVCSNLGANGPTVTYNLRLNYRDN